WIRENRDAPIGSPAVGDSAFGHDGAVAARILDGSRATAARDFAARSRFIHARPTGAHPPCAAVGRGSSVAGATGTASAATTGARAALQVVEVLQRTRGETREKQAPPEESLDARKCTLRHVRSSLLDPRLHRAAAGEGPVKHVRPRS